MYDIYVWSMGQCGSHKWSLVRKYGRNVWSVGKYGSHGRSLSQKVWYPLVVWWRRAVLVATFCQSESMVASGGR